MKTIHIKLSNRSGVPFHKQIFFQIAHSIRVGQLPHETTIPPAREMAARLLVSPITVRRAYSHLEAAGLLKMYSEQEIQVSKDAREASESAALIEGCELISNAVSLARSLGLSGELVNAAETQRLAGELKMAGNVQRMLLPDGNPECAGYDIAAITVPRGEIGGDLYDFIPLGKENLAFVIADVTAKGIPASLLVSTLNTAIHLLLEDGRSLTEVMYRTNRRFCASSPENRLAGLFLGTLHLPTGKLTSVNAGQDPPVLIRKDGRVETLTRGGLILGVLPDVDFKSEESVMEPGDLLMAVTDGITETRNDSGEEFGFERLVDFLSEKREIPARDLVRSLIDATEGFSCDMPIHDDRTILVIKKEETNA